MNMDYLNECPCGSGRSYSACCQRYHLGAAPETALLLMKSRYSAYAKGEVEYVLKTEHPEHENAKKGEVQRRKEIESFSRGTRFKKLEILGTKEDEVLPEVTFRAYLEQKGKEFAFTETSTFKKHEGRWCYLSGIHK